MSAQLVGIRCGRLGSRAVTGKGTFPGRIVVRRVFVDDRTATGVVFTKINVNDSPVLAAPTPGFAFASSYLHNPDLGVIGTTVEVGLYRVPPTMRPVLHIVRSRRSAWRRTVSMEWKSSHSFSRRASANVVIAVSG